MRNAARTVPAVNETRDDHPGPVEVATTALWQYAVGLRVDVNLWQVNEALAVRLSRHIDAADDHSDVSATARELRKLIAPLLREMARLAAEAFRSGQPTVDNPIGFQLPEEGEAQQ